MEQQQQQQLVYIVFIHKQIQNREAERKEEELKGSDRKSWTMWRAGRPSRIKKTKLDVKQQKKNSFASERKLWKRI